MISDEAMGVLRDIARDLVKAGISPNYIERTVSYITTEQPDPKPLLNWLKAHENDPYLAARSGGVSKHYRAVREVTGALLNNTGGDVGYTALLLAWTARLMVYYGRR
jgi:hypothetical protein